LDVYAVTVELRKIVAREKVPTAIEGVMKVCTRERDENPMVIASREF